jgi:hypothetical protein
MYNYSYWERIFRNSNLLKNDDTWFPVQKDDMIIIFMQRYNNELCSIAC